MCFNVFKLNVVVYAKVTNVPKVERAFICPDKFYELPPCYILYITYLLILKVYCYHESKENLIILRL